MRPLVIETSNPSGNGGTGDSGTTSSNTSPAPVVRGSNEPGQPQGTLGYQRDVYIYIDGTSFQVAGEQAVGITSNMSREQVAALLAERLRSRMATWEAAPEGGTWVPRIRFEIRRGGNAHLRQMADIVSEWQINWSANYTSE
jgi:alkanesulfonate monooxygenase SsuD/methylene tetrahydromethanopterin reductase-like flavin-dependent oxidoreductase (luciferase family)